MFSASSCFRLWNATPTHSPRALNAGPPEFPALIAASICSPRSSEEPCEYAVTSMRLTTPEVTEMATPPIGYPTTVTESCRPGSRPNRTGATSSKKDGSSAVSRARSHSTPMASTRATYFLSSPRFFSFTCVWCSTECALVKTLCPSMIKPELVDAFCRLRCHGSE